MTNLPWYNSATISYSPCFPDNASGSFFDLSRLAPSLCELRGGEPGLPDGRLCLVPKLGQKQNLDGLQSSWLDMYFTSPRITVLWLIISLPVPKLGERHDVEVKVSLRQSTGVTLRHVLAVRDEACRSHFYCTRDEALEDSGEASAIVGFFVGG